MSWRWARFDALAARDLYEVLRLRAEVFVVEQACIYLDADGLDLEAWHLLGRAPEGELVAYLRALPAGAAFAEPSIGRVAIAARWRGAGLGRRLMETGIERLHAELGPVPITIGAQSHLEGFYAGLGFQTVGPAFIEDGIPHLTMRRPASHHGGR